MVVIIRLPMVAFDACSICPLTQMEYCFLCFSPETATSSSLVSEDWALNMEICDMINSSEEGCVASNTTNFFSEI